MQIVKKFGENERLDILPPSVPEGPTFIGKSLQLKARTLHTFTEAFIANSIAGDHILTILNSINRDCSKMVVFGSSTLECFVPFHKDKHHDFDLLIYGVNTFEDVLETANVFDSYILQFGKTRTMVKPGLMQINLYPENYPSTIVFQIVLRHYKSLTQAASEIDFSPTAVFFDGTNLFFNEETRHGLMTQSIVLDTCRFSNASMKRLLKYHSRGFAITFPGILIDLFHSKQPLELCDGKLIITTTKTRGLFIYGKISVQNQPVLEYDTMPTFNKVSEFNMHHLGTQFVVRSQDDEACIDFSSFKTFEDVFRKEEFDVEKVKLVKSAVLGNKNQCVCNITILEKQFLFKEDEILNVVKMCFEKNEKASQYLLDKLESRYEKLRRVKIDFFRCESLVGTFDHETFYGKHNICRRGKVSLSLQVETLKSLVSNIFEEHTGQVQTCGICHSNLDRSEKNVLTMSCGHSHHFSDSIKCQGVETWLRDHKRNCPLCRGIQ